MRACPFVLALGSALVLIGTSEAMAGMPSIVLSDWAALRLETISFCLVLFFAAAFVVRWLWNSVAKDFPALPRLSYGHTLAALALWAALLAVVLTMIAGSRELMTPGAWQKDGLLYKVTQTSESEADTNDASKRLEQRKQRLRELHTAILQYAAEHGGKFPGSEDRSSIETSLWEVPGAGGMQYVCLPGRSADNPRGVLVCEPEVFGGERLVLYTNGELALVPSRELQSQLEAEKQP